MIVQGNRKGEITFVCNQDPQAQRVYLVGSFNNWDPMAKRMTRSKDGSFRARLKLAPGAHQYKFVIDGSWQHDDQGPDQIENELGTINSVVSIG
ncbi:MAG: isoamylase early set domain-containing protein [Sedimentisphaerales bacterium]|nr:isoamylase early set domain-containing protein [Sedimentisphaerales bacterium]